MVTVPQGPRRPFCPARAHLRNRGSEPEQRVPLQAGVKRGQAGLALAPRASDISTAVAQAGHPPTTTWGLSHTSSSVPHFCLRRRPCAPGGGGDEAAQRGQGRARGTRCRAQWSPVPHPGLSAAPPAARLTSRLSKPTSPRRGLNVATTLVVWPWMRGQGDPGEATTSPCRGKGLS